MNFPTKSQIVKDLYVKYMAYTVDYNINNYAIKYIWIFQIQNIRLHKFQPVQNGSIFL